MALSLAIALSVAPSVAAAKPKERVEPASRLAVFNAKGSKRWRLQVTTLVQSGKTGRQSIGFFTRGPHHEEVQYLGAKGRATADGLIEGRLPGIGRVAVRFEQTSEEPVTFVPERGCKAEGESATLNGVFRGRIELHGEGGYTTVDRRSAPGRIEVTPRVVCPAAQHHSRPPKATAEEAGVEYLGAGRKEANGGSLAFDAWATGLGRGGHPITDFSATYTHKRGSLTIFAATSILAEEQGVFSLTAPEGTPTEATVDPPAPFSGSAAFKLESPTTMSWTGDLNVEVPTLGRVNLTEPGFWAGACATHCTKTFPPGTSIGFFTFARLP